MKLGKIRLVFIILILSISNSLKAEDRILSAPIINLENLKPSYEELENDISLNDNNYNQIKERELEINKIKKGIMVFSDFRNGIFNSGSIDIFLKAINKNVFKVGDS